MKFTLLAQPLLAVTALAVPSFMMKRDLATIQAGISSVQKSLDDLGTAVNAVSTSDPSTLQGVLTASTNAQNSIQSATTSISGTSAISLTDALTLQQSATGLTTSVNNTVNALIAKKPVFDQVGASNVVGQQLQTQKTGAAGLGSAIVSKVPAIGQTIAQQSLGQINTALDKAIAVYGASNSTAAAAAAPATGATAGTSTSGAPKPAAPAAAPAAGASSAGSTTGATGATGAGAADGGIGAILGSLTGATGTGATGTTGGTGAAADGGLGAILGGL